MRPAPRAYFLAGQTAVGKTGLAHRLAQLLDLPILSADAMLVYRGMDIGTAKPSIEEREGIEYAGIDLVNPDAGFSTGAWLKAVAPALRRHPHWIVAGGTGLYMRALIQGLEPLPPAHPELRAELRGASVPDLQERLRLLSPLWMEALADPENPRRLERAIELATAGHPPPRQWDRDRLPPISALRMPPEMLRARIALRVDQMYDTGLLREAAALREQYPAWSQTSAGAIGYREALDCLDGRIDEVEARRLTVQRTRRYAKRQGTWLRNQLKVEWVELCGKSDPLDRIAEQMAQCWSVQEGIPLIGLGV